MAELLKLAALPWEFRDEVLSLFTFCNLLEIITLDYNINGSQGLSQADTPKFTSYQMISESERASDSRKIAFVLESSLCAKKPIFISPLLSAVPR